MSVVRRQHRRVRLNARQRTAAPRSEAVARSRFSRALKAQPSVFDRRDERCRSRSAANASLLTRRDRRCAWRAAGAAGPRRLPMRRCAAIARRCARCSSRAPTSTRRRATASRRFTGRRVTATPSCRRRWSSPARTCARRRGSAATRRCTSRPNAGGGLVEALVAAGAAVDARTNTGATPLMLAAAAGRHAADHRAPRRRRRRQRTGNRAPPHGADVRRGGQSRRAVKLLLARGADPNVATKLTDLSALSRNGDNPDGRNLAVKPETSRRPAPPRPLRSRRRPPVSRQRAGARGRAA